ncbi:MAG: TetR/AcrR family transcriptional regulator [Solibacillus sp.]
MPYKLQKRQQMLSSAKQLFTEYGFEKTTMQKIADEAGVGVATVFRYFPKKELLIIEVIKEVIEVMVPRFEAIANSPQTGYDKMDAILDAYIDYIFSPNREAIILLESFEYYVAYNPMEKSLIEEIHQTYNKVRHIVDHAIQDGVRDGSILLNPAGQMTAITIMNLFGTAIKKHAFNLLLSSVTVSTPTKDQLVQLKLVIMLYLKNAASN